MSWFVGDVMPGQSRELNLNLVAASAGEQRQLASVSAARGAKSETHLLTHIEGLSALLMELADVDDPNTRAWPAALTLMRRPWSL